MIMIHTLKLFILCLGLGPVTGEVMKVFSNTNNPSPPSCNGSLHLHLTNGSRISYVRSGELNTVRNISTTRIKKVEVHGCGCVQIFSSKNSRGKSYSLRPQQSLQDGDKHFFKVVRSFKFENCTNSASIIEAVVVSVVVAVILIGLAGVLFIRRWRMLGRAESDPEEVTDIEDIADCSKQNPGGQSESEQPTKPDDRVKESEM